jgi:uncharacterized membrane protein YjgN (DUF898 family)
VTEQPPNYPYGANPPLNAGGSDPSGSAQPYPPPPGPAQPYPPYAGQFPAGAPDNYLVWAVLSTVFCCLPLGVVAIVKSSQVNSLWAQGRYDEAQRSAAEAKKFAMWSAIVAGVLAVLYGIFVVVMMVVASMDHSAMSSVTSAPVG